MPRARCHWALLARTRDALARRAAGGDPGVALAHRGEFFAGGLAPDALRSLCRPGQAGAPTSTTTSAVRPGIAWSRPFARPIRRSAAPGKFPPPVVAWMLGYLAHVLTDVAYWGTSSPICHHSPRTLACITGRGCSPTRYHSRQPSGRSLLKGHPFRPCPAVDRRGGRAPDVTASRTRSWSQMGCGR